MSKFLRQWAKVEEELNEALRKAVVESAMRTYGEIVDRTPVGRPDLWKSAPPEGYVPGDLHQAWEISFGKGFKKVRAKRNYKSKLANFAAATSYRLGDTIWVRNRLPYAYRVEYGWSQQAPQGMMRTSVQKYKTFLDEAVRRNEK